MIMEISKIRELDFVKQLETEGFRVFLDKEDQIIRHSLKRNDFCTYFNDFYFLHNDIDVLKQFLEAQKKEIIKEEQFYLLLNAIRNRSNEFYFKVGTNSTCVILNPKDKRFLAKKHGFNFGIELNRECKLFGLEVLESPDVSENDFKVGF
jgi:hypothetical protein